MSGKRTKALRRKFIEQHGRPPHGATFDKHGQKSKDEFRQFKKHSHLNKEIA